MSNKVQITYKFLNDDNQLEIVDMVNENISGNYYAEYTINDLKYNSVLLIRNIQVLSKEV